MCTSQICSSAGLVDVHNIMLAYAGFACYHVSRVCAHVCVNAIPPSFIILDGSCACIYVYIVCMNL